MHSQEGSCFQYHLAIMILIVPASTNFWLEGVFVLVFPLLSLHSQEGSCCQYHLAVVILIVPASTINTISGLKEFCLSISPALPALTGGQLSAVLLQASVVPVVYEQVVCSPAGPAQA